MAAPTESKDMSAVTALDEAIVGTDEVIVLNSSKSPATAKPQRSPFSAILTYIQGALSTVFQPFGEVMTPHTVLFTLTEKIEDGVTSADASPHSWTVPAGCFMIKMSYCGGGNGGAGGHSASPGGGGGGGGASCTITEMPVPVVPGDTLTVTIGAGGVGGAAGATLTNTSRGGVTSITGISTGVQLPTGRPGRLSSDFATPGTGSAGGNGGAGAPQYPDQGGPAGGTGATASADATKGAIALQRGRYITTGGAGGGGAFNPHFANYGGSDTKHADYSVLGDTGSGGGGGASHWGLGSVDGVNPGAGYGAGGAGGYVQGSGFDGMPGACRFEYVI